MRAEILKAVLKKPQRMNREVRFECPKCQKQFIAYMINGARCHCVACGWRYLSRYWKDSYAVDDIGGK